MLQTCTVLWFHLGLFGTNWVKALHMKNMWITHTLTYIVPIQHHGQTQWGQVLWSFDQSQAHCLVSIKKVDEMVVPRKEVHHSGHASNHQKILSCQHSKGVAWFVLCRKTPMCFCNALRELCLTQHSIHELNCPKSQRQYACHLMRRQQSWQH